MDDLTSKILQQMEEMDKANNPSNWRNYDVQKVKIMEENLPEVAQLVVFQETFKESNHTIEAQLSKTETLLWVTLIITVICLITATMFMLRCCRKKVNKELQTINKDNAMITLSDTLACLRVTASTNMIIHPNTLQGLSTLTAALFANLLNKYDQLETSAAFEAVVSQIDDVVAKLNNAVNEVDLNNIHGRPISFGSQKSALAQRQEIERIKKEFGDIREELLKIIYLDENKYKRDAVDSLRKAIEATIVNEVMDYYVLLQEYQYTSHFLYAEAQEFIEEYYSMEAIKLEHSNKSELSNNLTELSESFKTISIEETKYNDSQPSTNNVSSTASPSVQSANIPPSLEVPSEVVTISTPLSPTVLSMFVIESGKVKREARAQLTSQMESLKAKRVDNEYRAKVWARKIVEDRRSDIRSSRQNLENTREVRMLRLEQSRIDQEAQHRQLQSDLIKEKDQQQVLDRRWFVWVALIVALVYVIVYSEWDPDRRGTSWGDWVTTNIRRTCSLVECKSQLVVYNSPIVSAEFANVPLINAPVGIQLDGSGNIVSERIAMSKPPPMKVLNAFVSYSPLSMVMSYVMPTSISASIEGMFTSDTTRKYWRCFGYFAMRSIAPWILGRANHYLRWKSINVFFVALYSFSDLVLKMANGPLQPLLWLSVFQLLLYFLLTRYDNYSSWNVEILGFTCDMRVIVLNLIYPLLMVFISATISCIHNINSKEESLFEKYDSVVCMHCIYHSWYSLTVVVGNVVENGRKFLPV